MGSIEVYDYKQMKWVPYVPHPDQAERYYQRLVASLDTQSHPSTIATKLKDTEDKLKEAEHKLKRREEKQPEVKQVTQVAEAIERARSEQKRDRKKISITQTSTHTPSEKNKKKKKKTSIVLPKRSRNIRYGSF